MRMLWLVFFFLGLAAYARASEISVKEAPSIKEASGFSLDALLGGSVATETPGAGDYDRNYAGASLGLALDYGLTSRWELGGFLQKNYSAGSGIVSVNYYSRTMYGLESSYGLVRGDTFSLWTGVRAGRASVTGMNTFLGLVPYGVSEYENWGAGPKVSLLWNTSQSVALGLQISYMQVMGGQMDKATVISTEQPQIRSFGIADIDFAIRFLL